MTDFDISDNTAVRAFTRQKLDPISKDPVKPCGLFVIHHTNKMQSDNARRPTGGKDVFAHSEDEARYPFWTEVTPADDDKTSEEKKSEVERLRAETLENDVSLLVAKITVPMTATHIREQARLLFGKNRGDDVYKEFAANSEKHGIIQHKGVNNNSKQFGTPAMLRDN